MMLLVARTCELMPCRVVFSPMVRPASRKGRKAAIVLLYVRVVSPSTAAYVDESNCHFALGWWEAEKSTVQDIIDDPTDVCHHVVACLRECSYITVAGSYVGTSKGTVVSYPTGDFRDRLVSMRRTMETCLDLGLLRFVHLVPENHHMAWHVHPRYALGRLSHRAVKKAHRAYKKRVLQLFRDGLIDVVPF